MAAKIQLRRDTASDWARVNPTLALGEPGVETDTYKVKVGDGTSDWNTLPYSITTQFADLNGKPTTIAGYAISDAYTKAEVDAIIEAPSGNLTGSVFADDSTVMVDGVSATLNLVNNTTTDLAEGTNLYYTDVRADARITAILQDDDTFASPSATNIASSESIKAYVDAQVASKDALSELSGSTDDVTEGSTNLYYTDARADARITAASITDLSDADQSLQTTDNVTFANITATGYIAGPATFTIDPAAVGDNTGTVVIAGDLQVDGTTTTINSTTVNVDDLNIQLATGAINAAAANGAGITVDGAGATITYDGTNDAWHVNKSFGIGTNAPALALDVATSGGAAGQFNRHLLLSRGTTVGGSLGTIRAAANNDVSALVMGVNTDQTLTITDAGRVGIGTTDPDRLFTVSGAGGVLVSIVSTDDDNCQLMFGDSASDTIGKIIYRHADDRLTLQAGNTETVHVVGGKVGINFNNPSDDIHILGTAASPSVGITVQSHDTANATAALSLFARNASNVNITSEIKNVGGQLFIERSDAGTDVLALKSTAAGAGGPQLDFYHHSASPANNDVVGTINFNGWDNASNATTYARLSARATDVTNGSEKGEIKFAVRADGSNFNDVARITDTGSTQIGYNGAAYQQADSQALSIITPASGGGQGIALKRLDSNTDQGLGEISWSNNTQDGLANIRVKTDGAVNTTDMLFETSAAGSLISAIKIDGSKEGNVGIGPVDPLARLHVDRSTSDNAQRTIYADGTHSAISSSGTNYLHNVWIENHNFDIDSGVTDSGYRIGLNIEGYHDSSVFEGTLATQKNIWSRNGNNSGGTGTITNSYNLHLETLSGGGITITNNYGLYQSGAGTKNYFEGDVGIGNTDPSSKLEVGNGSSTYVKIRNASSGDVSSGYNIMSGSTTTTSLYGNAGEGWTTLLSGGALNFRVNNASAGFNPLGIATDGTVNFTNIMKLDGNGAYYISTAANGYRFNNSTDAYNNVIFAENGNVTIRGALSKGSGSFRIPHPVESKTATHDLVHSFLEAPQADNLYRGKVDLVAGTATVNIDTVAGMTEGTFAALNREVQCFTSNETGWTAVKGSVLGNTLTIIAQDNSCTDTISWMVVGERKDQHMYDTDWTDDNGKVIVEPTKRPDKI